MVTARMSDRLTAWQVVQRVLWVVALLFSAWTLFRVSQYLSVHRWGYEPALSPKVFSVTFADNGLLLVHIVTAIPCLALGPFLMLPRFRLRFPRIHRWMGKVYIAGVLVSAVLGFTLASGNEHGLAAKLGFMSLATVWFVTTFNAYRRIRAGDLPAHRRWMLRSYAISLAVVTVRLLGRTPAGFTRDEWYPIMTWACWVPNFVLAEIYVRVTDGKGRFALWRNVER